MSDGTTVQLQKAIVARLRGTPAVVALCPSAAIFDRSTRPEVPICILLGEDQVVFEGLTYAQNHVSIFTTLHLWQKAQDFTTLKNLADAIRSAMRPRLFLFGATVVRTAFSGARFLRDPGGEYVHAVVTFESLIEEPAVSA